MVLVTLPANQALVVISTTEFIYGIGHQRFYRHDQRTVDGSKVNTHTAYLSGLEKVYRSKTNSDSIEYKFYIGNVVITERTNAANNASTNESYLHKDHLGSPLSITNNVGKIIQQNVYDPWGKVHQLYLDDIAIGGNLLPTTRGYTGHEDVAGLDIIHMNGRIYDAHIGRFLQADPHIQAPQNSQSFNRYAYVINNPLTLTDPSGFFFSGLKKFVKKWGKMIVAAVVSYYTFGLATGWVAMADLTLGAAVMGGAAAGFVNGAIMTGSLKGAIRGGISGAIMGAVGGAGLDKFGSFAASGVAGGILSDVQGGNFGHGFWSAGLGAATGGQYSANPYMQVLASAVVGGTISRLTGGKFANGAHSAAFAAALRADWSHKKDLQKTANGTSGENSEALPKSVKTAINKAMVAKDYQKAAELAAKYLDIDITTAGSFKANFNRYGAYGTTDGMGNVIINHIAFSSPEALVSTVGHEFVHVKQWMEGTMDLSNDSQQGHMNEVEGHQWELNNIAITGFTAGYRGNVTAIKDHMSYLDDANYWRIKLDKNYQAVK